jgi:outer membrane protein TolC
MRRRTVHLLARASVVALAMTTVAAAATAAKAKKASPAGETPMTYEAPKFSYGDGQIGLAEALRLTLAHDPNLLLKREDVRFQQGLLEEISGAFDWVLSANLSWNHQEQELRNSVIQAEKDKRDQLSVQNQFYCTQVPVQDQKISKLQQALAGQPIVPSDFNQNTDAFFQAQLQYYQLLLQNAQSQQERDAILSSRTVLLNRELITARETRKSYDKACNDTGDALAKLGKIPEFEVFDTGKVDLRLQKLFRSGVGFSPFITGDYNHTQYKGKKNGYFVDRLDADGNPVFTEYGTKLQRFVDFGGKNIEDLYQVDVGFDINIPLLRGRGVNSTGAPEKSAEVDLEASQLALRHAAAVSALNTAGAYWQLLAAQQRVDIFQRSVDLETRLVDLTDQLIAGDVLPRVERARALAGQTNAQAQLEGARRDLVSARLALARTIGVDVESQANAPLAEGPFPTAPEIDAITALDPAQLANQSVGRRADSQSAHRLVESGQILAEAARLDLRNQLDVGLSLSADALGEASLSNAVDRWTGPSGVIQVQFAKEIGNRTFKGRLGQRDAIVRQRDITAGDLDRTIRIGVVQNLRALQDAVARLQQAEAAAGYFQQTTDAEFEKLKAGASTLIDAILTEQQQTSADLTVLSARQEVATLLAQLRFETGTLVQPEGTGGGTLSVDTLTTLPGLDAAPTGGRP